MTYTQLETYGNKSTKTLFGFDFITKWN